MPPTRQLPRTRLRGKFLVGNGCWEWTAAKGSQGYGEINAGGKHGRPLPAHRVVYEWLVGPIPTGLVLDHLCRNRGCVNPGHLEPVTEAENIRRGTAGLIHQQRMAAVTHCKWGHEFDEANTYIGRNVNGRPRRDCRACRARRQRERTAQRGIVG